MNSGWICACPRLVVWAVSERNRSETERSLQPLDKNPLRAPTIFCTLRSSLAPRSAPLTCSGERPADRRALEGAASRSFRDVQAMLKRVRESEESSFCDWRVVLNSPTWPCPRAACRIRLSVWGGAPPMSRLSGGGIYVVRHSSHSVEDTNLQILYACLVTHDAKA